MTTAQTPIQALIQTEEPAPQDGVKPQDAVEYRIIGPPGCGKTTWLGRQVSLAASQDHELMISSLTKSAAAEIAGRDLPISPESLGTLHSHCFQSLGRPSLAEDKDNIKQWNERYPEYKLSPGKNVDLDSDNLEVTAGINQGDKYLAAYQMARSRMQEPHHTIQDFVNRWEEWKEEKHLLDFVDLVDVCLRDVPKAPMEPRVIFVDEAQDLDKMEMALVRKWGTAAGKLILVGDPDQAIFTWRGADPQAFIDPDIPIRDRWVLAQSWRVPRQVHAIAVDWINQVQERERVEYLPRDEEGEVRRIRAGWKQPAEIVQDAQEYVSQGKSVMFLATCSYMLTDLITEMKAQGIPFHNPYRTTNGAWNPLAKRKNLSSAADRITHFLNMYHEASWTPEQLDNWLKNVKTKDILTLRGKDWVKSMNKFSRGLIDYDDLEIIMTPDTLEAGMTGDLDWYESHLKANKVNGSQFPLQVARTKGIEGLQATPKIVLGTIHSIKGGESDVVYLFPDLSIAGYAEWNGGPNQQAQVMRLFYVGMTRARESLVLCNPTERRTVSF